MTHPFSAKLLVTSGRGSESQTTEIIDLKNPNSKCKPWQEYPLNVYASFGQDVDGSAIICGGVDTTTYEVMSNCYHLQPNNVTLIPSLKTPSSHTAVGVLDNSLFVVGGSSISNGWFLPFRIQF